MRLSGEVATCCGCLGLSACTSGCFRLCTCCVASAVAILPGSTGGNSTWWLSAVPCNSQHSKPHRSMHGSTIFQMDLATESLDEFHGIWQKEMPEGSAGLQLPRREIAVRVRESGANLQRQALLANHTTEHCPTNVNSLRSCVYCMHFWRAGDANH